MIIENARDFVLVPSCQVNVPQIEDQEKDSCIFNMKHLHLQHPPVAEKGLKGRGRERVTGD